ncbi:MAG: uridine kinase family protein [bacterium]
MNKKFEEIKSVIDHLLAGDQEVILVAIDGMCGAGKSTLAAALQSHYDANLFHLDDFFLQEYQRTPERYREAGGNVDYERFDQEVIKPLKAAKDPIYRPFDCQSMTIAPGTVVPLKRLNIIEGTYACHPYFHDPYDYSIFLTIDPDFQLLRLKERSADNLEAFITKWIPLENAYFSHYGIKEKADQVIMIKKGC